MSLPKALSTVLMVVAPAMRVNLDNVANSTVDLNSEVWEDFAIKEEAQDPGRSGAGCTWPQKLAAKYTGEFVVGTGATACVYIAQYQGNAVAVKVAKGTNAMGEWRKECSSMQQMRVAACRAGSQQQQLAEMFLPTCLEVGSAGSSAYYVMQAAGTRGISDYAKTIVTNKNAQKRTFAQVVASVYAMHGNGYTHNDLHGHNIVVDSNNDVALIDFGEIKGHHRGLGYKHDINSVWRWAAVLGDCPDNAQFPRLMKSFFSQASKSELTERSGHLLDCLQTKWNADAEFIDAFRTALEGAVRIDEDQKVELLFNSNFVQSNLPPLQSVYPYDGNGRCSNSGLSARAPAALSNPSAGKKVASGRPSVGDLVQVNGRCATIVKDDKDATPFKVEFHDDGSRPNRFWREVQVKWSSACLDDSYAPM